MLYKLTSKEAPNVIFFVFLNVTVFTLSRPNFQRPITRCSLSRSQNKNKGKEGSGCGWIGRAVVSGTWGLRFKSSHLTIDKNIVTCWNDKIKKQRPGKAHLKAIFGNFLYWTFMYCQLSIGKTKWKEKEAGNVPLK